MTAKQYPPGATKNKEGNGRGLKAVTKPIRKKRGASAELVPETIAENRRKYRNASNTPAAEIADSIDPNKPLTEKAKLFVKFWAEGESIATASARAGYGDGATYAYKVAKFPQALTLYDKIKKEYEEASMMTKKKIIDMHMEAFEMAKLLAEPASMVASAREVGKLCGYYEPIRATVDVTVNGSVVMERMNKLTDAELLKIIQDGISHADQELLGNDN